MSRKITNFIKWVKSEAFPYSNNITKGASIYNLIVSALPIVLVVCILTVSSIVVLYGFHMILGSFHL